MNASHRPLCPRPRLTLLTTAALAASLAACDGGGAGPSGAGSARPAPSAVAAGPVTVTILYTADENGWLLPEKKDGKNIGGASEMLGAWITNEHHCTGNKGTAKPCDKATTIALSGGDTFSGAPISHLFQGEPMAEAMAFMGYMGTALGNKDLDFGKAVFSKNKDVSRVAYLGANVKADKEVRELLMRPYLLVQREGAKIGVIGVASQATKGRAMPDRFFGIEFEGVEESLSKTVPEVWKAGADAIVVVAHECPDKLVPVFQKHADWKISFVGGANCSQGLDDRSTGTVMIAPDKRLRQYARAALTIDLSKPAKERVTKVDAKAVDVIDGPAVPEMTQLIEKWKKKVDAVLGEEIGFTEKGIEQSDAGEDLITRAWREQLGVDVALINKKGVEALPAGAITKASVFSMMPFDNSLMLVEVNGADLLDALENKEAVASGAVKEGKTWKVGDKPLDPAGTYKVATVEYLYFGGDGFQLQKADPEPTETGMDWRTPVIEWAQALKSSQKDPLEKRLKEPSPKKDEKKDEKGDKKDEKSDKKDEKKGDKKDEKQK